MLELHGLFSVIKLVRNILCKLTLLLKNIFLPFFPFPSNYYGLVEDEFLPYTNWVIHRVFPIIPVPPITRSAGLLQAGKASPVMHDPITLTPSAHHQMSCPMILIYALILSHYPFLMPTCFLHHALLTPILKLSPILCPILASLMVDRWDKCIQC